MLSLKNISRLSRYVSSVNRCAYISTTHSLRDTFTIQDEDDFSSKVLESKDPVVVDFSAKWCGPCKLLTPRLDAALAATGGKVHLAIVDIDNLADLAIEQGVQAVPTVIAFKGGKMTDKFVGLIEEDKLHSFVQKLVE
jgi:thioredoxin